jgi:hypothetical protein
MILEMPPPSERISRRHADRLLQRIDDAFERYSSRWVFALWCQREIGTPKLLGNKKQMRCQALDFVNHLVQT